MAFNSICSISTCSQAINRRSKLLWLCILLLSSAIPTLQVDINITHVHADLICQNILPGVCCSMVTHWGDDPTIGVQFRHLEAYDVAAVWQRNRLSSLSGCAGIPWQTRWGPGTWQVGLRGLYGNEVIGAPLVAKVGALATRGAPIRLATIFRRKLCSLAAESTTGSEDGRLAKPSGHGRACLGRRTVVCKSRSGIQFGSLAQESACEKGHQKPQQGTVYITPPPRWVYPNLIIENGTEYVSDGPQSLTYRSTDGEVLHIFDRP